MRDVFRKITEILEYGENLVLVTIIDFSGSTPRGAGSQMLIGEDGYICGTIGGGAIEERSIEHAMKQLVEKKSDIRDFSLRKGYGNDIGMACGGEARVFFQYIDGTDDRWHELSRLVVDRFTERRKGWLIQHLDGSLPTLLDENGACLIGDELGVAAPEGELECTLGYGNTLTEKTFTMPLPIEERAIIFGGGHCAYALAKVLQPIGFRVIVMDNREKFANPRRFPNAEQIVVGDYTRISDYMEITAEDYVVVMTSGHTHDYEVEEQVLRGEYAYLGVIGSRKKTASVNDRLRAAGIPEGAIESVHAPIGLDIKAVTPEEIAISVAAEMIQVRAARRAAVCEESHVCPMK